jgi:hypothetical protein
MYSYFDSFIENKWWLLLWIIVNCGPMWFVIATNTRSKPDPKLDPRFKPFVRADYNHWSYLHAIWTHLFYLPRLVVCIALFISVGVVPKLVYMFNTEGSPRKQW